MKCTACSFEYHENFKFCPECATILIETKQPSEQTISQSRGERKYATILFSDLSGYTAITEKMDPEDVKNMMEDIFEKAGKIVEKYQGTVDSFFGDEMLILFGVPRAHEDDPIRAVHAALEIHRLVEELSPEFEKQNFGKLTMHSGINSGLIITGDKYIGKGRQGLAGDTINLASRLTKLAKPGEIVVGPATYKMASNYFSFKSLKPVSVKGKKDPVQAFKINDTLRQSRRTKQLKGVKADLIGRSKELIKFGDAVKALKSGQGTVLCLYGYAGSGKSRLVEEFKATSTIQWFEGYTYPYTKNMPYFSIITLFNQAIGLREDDSSDILKIKIEKGLSNLIQNSNDIIPYIGSLYSLNYPEIESVSPEFFKSKLFNAVYSVLKAIAHSQPTVICIEDLHWADPSSLDLIRFIHSTITAPILFLYVTRPVIEIFSDSQIEQMKLEYQDIKITDLSAEESKIMVQSLLDTKQIPPDLETFIEKKTQGNPFYLEEIINSLIESNILRNKGSSWELERKITEYDISSSIHGVLAARVDRLETESKQTLQEASVIGRTFYYKIINQITETKKDIQGCLKILEGLDLIKSNKSEIDLEYIFKHALTQEVVYKGILKAQRRLIHEKIGTIIEQVFYDRLPEFYETLALHFLKGSSTLKAVDYLIKSGDKSIKHYSLDEAHDYFQKAFDLIQDISDKSPEISKIIIKLINKWAMVFYYLGTFEDLDRLLFSQEDLIDKMDDNEIKGMFFAWQGFVLEFTGRYLKAEICLNKALDLGTRINSPKVMGHAYAWLAWVHADLGDFKKGIEYGQKANKIGKDFNLDHYVYFKSLAGVGWNYFGMGYASELIKTGELLIEYGNEHSQVRSISLGHYNTCLGYIHFGDLNKAIASGEKAVNVAADPLYEIYFTMALSFAYIQNNDMQSAGACLEKAWPNLNNEHDKFVGDIAVVIKGVLLIDKGRMSEGLKIIKGIERELIQQHRKGFLAICRSILGKIYFEIIQGNKALGIPVMIKNIGFIFKNVPSAHEKAIYWYTKAIELAEETGAIGIKAQAHFDLGILHRIKKQNNQARDHLEKAVEIFEEVGAYAFLKQAKKELNSLAN
jgi:class 3 adenylate cyclase/tetratricopeptide (TPR) repeat protein